jgi:hypothetical protein
MNAFADTAPRDRFITLLMSSIRILLASDLSRWTSSSVHGGDSRLLAARCLCIDDPNLDFIAVRTGFGAFAQCDSPYQPERAALVDMKPLSIVMKHSHVLRSWTMIFLPATAFCWSANGRTRMSKTALEPEDFPVSAEQRKVVTHNGEPIADAHSQDIAGEIADRLNEHAADKEEDRWAL